ncbi:MAG: recombinase family protein [Pirellulaceae bacterium]|nr:recombinase family protein [Pirellulaceae bacterium]
MTIACYCRVSTRQQKNDSQEAEIKKWLKNNGIHAAKIAWYFDHESGKTLSRPEFDRLQKDIFDGRVRTVIVWKLDRLPPPRHGLRSPAPTRSVNSAGFEPNSTNL